MASHLISRNPYRTLRVEHNEIRILVLKGAQQTSDHIHCSLRHIRLGAAESPAYETISYVWGDVTLKSTIYVTTGHSMSARVLSSCYAVFVGKDAERVLWIDAVCINQNDIEERNRQVALMAQIYSNTAHGLVWLGPDEGASAAKAKTSTEAVLEDARKAIRD